MSITMIKQDHSANNDESADEDQVANLRSISKQMQSLGERGHSLKLVQIKGRSQK